MPEEQCAAGEARATQPVDISGSGAPRQPQASPTRLRWARGAHKVYEGYARSSRSVKGAARGRETREGRVWRGAEGRRALDERRLSVWAAPPPPSHRLSPSSHRRRACAACSSHLPPLSPTASTHPRHAHEPTRPRPPPRPPRTTHASRGPSQHPRPPVHPRRSVLGHGCASSDPLYPPHEPAR